MAATSSSMEFLPHAPTVLLTPGGSEEISIPLSAHSLRGFRNWALSEDFPDRGRFSFIKDQLIVDMSPEYFETHNAIKVEVTSVIHGRVKHLRLGYVFGDRSLLSNESAGLSTEPDAFFVRHSSFRSGRCQLVDSPRPGVAQELVGTPDWVLEIVSQSSIRKDTKLLRESYYKAGIGEYWLVNALADGIDFEILVLGQHDYVAVHGEEGWIPSPTFNCLFRLIREKDDDGFWLYTLQVNELS